MSVVFPSPVTLSSRPAYAPPLLRPCFIPAGQDPVANAQADGPGDLHQGLQGVDVAALDLVVDAAVVEVDAVRPVALVHGHDGAGVELDVGLGLAHFSACSAAVVVLLCRPKFSFSAAPCCGAASFLPLPTYVRETQRCLAVSAPQKEAFAISPRRLDVRAPHPRRLG